MHPIVSVLTGRLSRKLSRPLMSNRTPIFMLHRVEDRAAGVPGHTINFVRQALTALRESGAKFVSLRELVDAWVSGKPIGPDWIVFTIDDGFADQGELIEQAFVPMECPVTVFLITGFLDGQLWPWDDQLTVLFSATELPEAAIKIGAETLHLKLGTQHERMAARSIVRNKCKTVRDLDPYEMTTQLATVLEVDVSATPPPAYRAMSWDTVRRLERSGAADFGPHSVTHRIFSCMTDEQASMEMSVAWERLTRELERPLPVMAWPTGGLQHFSQRDMDLAGRLGMRAAVSTFPDYAHRSSGQPESSLYRMNRFSLPNDLSSVLRYGSWLERGRQLIPL